MKEQMLPVQLSVVRRRRNLVISVVCLAWLAPLCFSDHREHIALVLAQVTAVLRPTEVFLSSPSSSVICSRLRREYADQQSGANPHQTSSPEASQTPLGARASPKARCYRSCPLKILADVAN